MKVKVRFRFNIETGEVERFQVDDVGSGFGAAHDATHDRVSAELGSVVADQPEVDEIPVGAPQDPDQARHIGLQSGGWSESVSDVDDNTEGPESAAR
ncbi:hypothetical protein ACWEQ7_30345 [Streptomyces sp. NPDC004069]